tara:strand:+ start:1966 stop:2157 length:192 start_codon:yes stop_codon:yes gene_type:complete
MKNQNILVDVDGNQIEFYPKEAHGAWYQVGTNGEIGALYMAMNLDGTADTYSVCEIEVKWEDA